MSPYKNTVMIAFVPTTTDWSVIDFPHLTLVYAGEKDNLRETAHNELLKSAVTMALEFPKFKLNVLTKTIFGEDDERVDVLTLTPLPDLLEMRKQVAYWNASQYKDYKPHVTIGPVGTLVNTPKQIEFDKIAVCWGDQKTMFELL
jgi:2'-5' RNA ligase